MIARVALTLAMAGTLAVLTAEAEALPMEVAPPAPAGDPGLQAELEGCLARLEGSYGIATVSLEDGSTAYVDADTIYPAASMYKLLVMYRVFQQVEAGELSMGDPLTIEAQDMMLSPGPDGGFSPGDTPSVEQALHSMIAISSNSAASALVRTVGGWPVVTSAADELGMHSTYASDGEFWSTPADLASFFLQLADRSLVNAEASDRMIELLRAQQINDRIPALLPEGVEVAHKTGELPGVRNDGGIVWGPGGSYVLVVMGRSVDPNEAVSAEAEISRLVYDRLGA